MTDREKVMLAVSHCLRSNDCSICEACPYNESNDYGCRARLRDDIVRLLKAQEIGKVNITITQSDGWKEGNCPFCGMKVDSFYNWSFCGTCGKGLKWDG